ncbi:MAG TPA: fumarylacetoacetate hydrolase family protein [Ilumatobacter sp.]|nr:fumarylacetoacetate hydrolase family protein [Ilumatobacter sp.]
MRMDSTVAAVADRLHQAAEQRLPTKPVRDELAVGGLAAAYAVQRHNQDRAVAAGRRIVGRKVGLTSLAVQRQLGVDSPDFGVIFADMCDMDGDEVLTGSVLQPKVEAEVALVVGRDLSDPDLTMFELIAAVDHLLPAIEVVGSRIENWDISLLDTVADNASCGRVVLGMTPVAPSGLDLAAARMAMTVDGVEASVGTGAACLGHPYRAALWVARTLAGFGEGLRAGDLVMTGALGPMVSFRPGTHVRTTIEDLGEVNVYLSEEQ